MKKNLFIVSLCLVLGGCLCFSCGSDDDGIVYGQENTNPGGGPLLTTETAVRLRLETPATKSGNLVVSHWSVEGGDSVMTYCLEYDPVKHHSRWVAFRFDGRTRANSVERKKYDILPQYPEDPKLNGQNAIEDDARFNGYDHGHLCASADRLYSRTANDNTFYMTNMSPQIGHFNQYYWVVLEGLVQDLGKSGKYGANFADTLYVVKGGTIDNADQILGYACSNRMPVPKYYYMALLRVKNGAYSSIAFWMEHKDYGTVKPSLATIKQHCVSVQTLQNYTGIDFFHNLPDVVEQKVEQQCDPSSWGM